MFYANMFNSMECFLQSLWQCKFLCWLQVLALWMLEGGVNYDIIVSLLMKYYSKNIQILYIGAKTITMLLICNI